MTIMSTTNTCRWCNSPITSEDKICKHCHEYQTDNTDTISLKDPTLSTCDWIIIICSQLIGMLTAIIYFNKGEILRGKRLIKYSLIILVCKLLASYPVYYIFKTFYKVLKSDI